MQTITDFFNFPSICCDAEAYLRLGQGCAEHGDCYDALRPIGSILWFSLPYRMGISPSVAIIAAHLLLALLSILLSVLAMHSFFKLCEKTLRKQLYFCFAFFIVSVISHAVFLNPTVQVPLSDEPASLIALIAIWLLFISHSNYFQKHSKTKFLLFALAGLSLGIAAWIRVFFLYPVILILLIFPLLWLRNRKNNMAAFGLLFALLPILIQVYATWKHTGTFSYIDPQVTHKLIIEHRDNKSIGYDMVIDARGIWNWYSDCPEYKPLIQSLQEHDFYSLSCLISGRIHFYLGSYSPHNFVNLGGYDMLWGENLAKPWHSNSDNHNIWNITNLKREPLAMIIVDHRTPADQLTKMDPTKSGEIYQILELHSNPNPYVFSTWLWGNNKNYSVDLIVREHETKNIIAKTKISLSPEKSVKSLNAIVSKSGIYDLVIQIPTFTSSVSASEVAMPKNTPVYLWEDFDMRLPEANIENSQVSKIRIWSPWILLPNSLAFFVSVWLLGYKAIKEHSAIYQLAFLFLIMVCGQAILSLPEQRFAITPMITAWVIFLSWTIMTISKIIPQWRKYF